MGIVSNMAAPLLLQIWRHKSRVSIPFDIVMCKACIGIRIIKRLCNVCPPVREIIHSLKLMDYPQVQADLHIFQHSG